MKSKNNNLLYIFLDTFSSDLLFWIVISNLFLTNVKGLSTFDIMLTSLVGGVAAIVLYPLINLIIRKLKNHASLILGCCLLLAAIVLYTVCSSIWGFFAASICYVVSLVFTSVKTTMLKANLNAQNRGNDFVKIQSWGKLGYSIITCVIAVVTGFMFNFYPYLPMFFSIGGAIIAIVLSIFYTEPPMPKDMQVQSKKFDLSIFKNKTIWLLFVTSFFAYGIITFTHSNSNLLMQNVLESYGVETASIALIISCSVLVSRFFRIAGVYFFPFVYRKTNKKPNVMRALGFLILVAGAFYAIGANVHMNFWGNVLLLSAGLCVLISIRDTLQTFFDRISLFYTLQSQHPTVISLLNVIEKAGRYVLTGLSVALLTLINLQQIFLVMTIVFVIATILVVWLSKYLKED